MHRAASALAGASTVGVGYSYNAHPALSACKGRPCAPALGGVVQEARVRIEAAGEPYKLEILESILARWVGVLYKKLCKIPSNAVKMQAGDPGVDPGAVGPGFY